MTSKLLRRPSFVLVLMMLLVVSLTACGEEDTDDDFYNFIENGRLVRLPPGGGELGDVALAIPYDHAVGTGDISDVFDADGWGFSLSYESRVVVSMEATGSLNPFVELYNLNSQPIIYNNEIYTYGEIMEFNDDDGPGLDAVVTGVLPAGRYGILTWSSESGPVEGNYELHVISSYPDGDDFGLVSIGYDGGFDGVELFEGNNIEPDTLSYVFTLTETAMLDFVVATVAGTPDVSMRLVDQEGSTIFTLDPAGTDDPVINDQMLNAGTYMWLISNAINADAGMVDLTLRVE